MRPRIHWTTAGESHGPALLGILEGLPAGVTVRRKRIAELLALRRAGAGRSSRQQEETDHFQLLAGVKSGRTLGSPIALLIVNQRQDDGGKRTIPRPGHVDYAMAARRNLKELSGAAERASARCTAVEVGLSAFLEAYLLALGIEASAEVERIGQQGGEADIAHARQRGETLGGSFLLRARGVPPGLGDNGQTGARLDAGLANFLLGIPGIRALEIGEGIQQSRERSPAAMDPLILDKTGRIRRGENRAGGLEGGLSNGEELRLRAFMKPIPTAGSPGQSLDLKNFHPAPAPAPRHDVCAVEAAARIALARLQLVLADACQERFGGTTLGETRTRQRAWYRTLRRSFRWWPD